MSEKTLSADIASKVMPEGTGDAFADRRHSYMSMLKSSALIGGSSLLNIGIGIVRTKAMALLLGPTGYGLMGAYLLLIDLLRSVAMLGLNDSGVRQIACAASTKDGRLIARTVMVLRRTSLLCAILGGMLAALFAPQMSRLTFGTDQRAGSIVWLSLAVVFSVIAGAQGALLQGLRRIGAMAKLSIIGNSIGAATSISLIYFMREDGLVPAIIIAALCSVATSWLYSRKVQLERASLNFKQFAAESRTLLTLGLAFMASNLLMAGTMYAVRTIVLRKTGLESAGIFYAAWTVGGLYTGFVLQALGADFYPRLVGVAHDNRLCNRLVNEQAQISMLLAIPGVLLTLTIAPELITIFYSARFGAASEVLRWICLGMAMRVLTWPMGFIVVAKNRQALFISIDLAWAAVMVGLTWILVAKFGAAGAGIAFFLSYIFHCLLVYPVVRQLSNFTWNSANQRTLYACVIAIAIVFIAVQMLPRIAGISFGLLLSAAATYLALRRLMQLVSPDKLPRPLLRLMQIVRPKFRPQ